MKNIITSLMLAFSVYSYSQTEKETDSIVETSINALDEIVIVKKKVLYTQKSDRMVFNVENSIVSEGGTALDVLSRAPGVVVSQDGELSIRGQQGVGVMINGKLTQLSQKELANYLKSTTSSNIKQIEVITNPSSKYDATGKAGIINIILKKPSNSGLKGTAFSSYGRGRKNRTNSGINLSYNKDKFGVYGNYSYTFRGEEERKKYDQIQYTDNTRQEIVTKNYQNATTDEPLTSNNFKIGTTYEISPKTNLEAYVDAKIGRYENIANGRNTLLNAQDQLQFDALTYNDSKEKWNDYTYAFSGVHKFDTEGKNMTFDFEYETSKFRSNQFQSAQNTDQSSSTVINDRRGFIPSQLKVFTGKVDFTNPLKEKESIEWGFKAGLKNNDNPSVYEYNENNQWIIDANSTNHFEYKEQIYAAYANYKYQMEKLNIQGGLRTEYTAINILQKTLNEEHKDDYLKWFPSVSMKYEFNENNSVHASYSKRINRPSQFDLNPFRFYDDSFNYSQGNPNLVPEITHAAEIGYAWKSTFMASVYFSKTKDVFTEVYVYNPATNTTVTSQINVDKSYNYGVNITNTNEIYKWWSLNTLFNVFENKFMGNTVNTDIIDPIITFNLSAQNAFTISETWKAEANAQYQSKSNLGIYERADFFDFSIGISKQILANKGNIKLNFTDIFNTNNFDIKSVIGQTGINKQYELDNRIATIAFTYRI
ncbi:outer membrane beta-barrel family protein [Flavobacterium pectinovorum]|uniref:Outer membrane receptor proteins, mostly Fe transport n=1 Tax=Flavobacterium pectinovorum TaxID=29533 RepID=A0AB36P2H0_9FLAO|nr:outer membrane beta-barrel family protein [Flavobacterium pectinovorum]OXB05899.1 TonB-dependent receptor [Flavobacterium pectinovorum]SHM15732.1 Outer membrane receptor proteins, mostly Fe transport [Flavobacterium pectinovorum]